jgi:hypothetical protein
MGEQPAPDGRADRPDPCAAPGRCLHRSSQPGPRAASPHTSSDAMDLNAAAPKSLSERLRGERRRCLDLDVSASEVGIPNH